MTLKQLKEKELLLKDLCARLPYGIKCTTKLTGYNDVYVVQGVYEDNVFIDSPVYEEGDDEWMIESIIPFLRPLSSMTEEELKEFAYTILQQPDLDAVRDWQTLSIDLKELPIVSDWLNRKMFDYRGLIPRGLAIEAPEGMYK